MKKLQPKIVQFTNYPLIAVRNSYITIQWKVKNALFVYINNGIGLRTANGIKLTTLNKSATYKLIAFGWFGKKVKYLCPITLRVNNKVPVPELEKWKTEITKTVDINKTAIIKAVEYKHINNLNIRYKKLKVCPDIKPLHSDLNQLMACETTEELDKFRDFIVHKKSH